MKRYEKYKPSGIEWIGEVPEHWGKCRFKNFMCLITKPSVSMMKIGLENIESGTGKFILTDSEFEGNGVEFLENDVVYGKLRPYLQKVWLSTFEGNAVGDFFVFRARRNSDAKYIQYLLLSDGFTREADGATFGAKMPRVSSDFILSMNYFLPPVAEQQTIATYLDARCAGIDKVLATQQKRIALLKELKQSEITKAVTQGLNPDARMKDSGVEWIGMVPEHWERCRFKDFITLVTKPSVSETKIGLENIESGTGRFVETDSEFEGNGVEFYENDLVYGKLRPYLQKVWLATFKGNAVGDCFVFREKRNACSHFLKYLLLSDGFTKETDGATVGAKMPRVSSDFILTMRYYLPKRDEQVEIAAYLDHRCGEIDRQIEAVTKQIELLKEYKQSLITEVVTGKRKVC